MDVRRHRGIIVLLVLLVFVLAAAVTGYFAIGRFNVTSVEFEGTDRYGDDELYSYIFGENTTLNTLKLSHDLKNASKVMIPFIETYEVEIEYPSTVKVVLYEKSIVACVLYKENYMYFDKDGIVVESSHGYDLSVPIVDGLKFESIILYSPLPVKSDKVFDIILNMSQSLAKTGVHPDRIHFNEDLTMVMYFDEVKIMLGSGDGIARKIDTVKELLPELAGQAGTLHLENYKEGDSYILFKKNE